jgi:hypothetical protein
MLRFTKIIVAIRIISSLNLFKGIHDIIFLLLIFREMKSLITVPVHVLLRTFLIDMLTVGDIESAVIVFRIVSSILAMPSVVSCNSLFFH